MSVQARPSGSSLPPIRESDEVVLSFEGPSAAFLRRALCVTLTIGAIVASSIVVANVLHGDAQAVTTDAQTAQTYVIEECPFPLHIPIEPLCPS